MKKEAIQSLASAVAAVTRKATGCTPAYVAANICQADRIGRQLQRRYLNACNHAWALTEAYEKGTDKLEARLAKLFSAICEEQPTIKVELQRDPRGWPVTIHVDGYQYSIGGR